MNTDALDNAAGRHLVRRIPLAGSGCGAEAPWDRRGDKAMKRKVPTAMAECFELIERKLLKVRGSRASSTRSVTRTCSRSGPGSKATGVFTWHLPAISAKDWQTVKF
jgi:hypothetical protein